MTIRNPIHQAYRQAPWRRATQAGVLFLILALLTASILWVMLTVTVQAASAGLEIQSLENEKEKLIREIASLRTNIAIQTSAETMLERARNLGFRQANPDEITYVVIPGYTGKQPQIIAPPPSPPSQQVLIKPSYTQSLSEWLFQGIIRMSEQTGGFLQ